MHSLEAGVRRKDVIMKKKRIIQSIIVLVIALAALVCAALSLHTSLNLLMEKEEE